MKTSKCRGDYFIQKNSIFYLKIYTNTNLKISNFSFVVHTNSK